MGFTPFAQFLPLSGGTITGPVTITGGVLTTAGISDSGGITSSGNINTTGLTTVTGGSGLNAGIGNLDIPQHGAGLKVNEGANGKQGTATLVAGTVTVANTSVTANSRIFLETNTPGGTPGWLLVSARVVGTSFTILSSSATDTSVVAWEIFEPG